MKITRRAAQRLGGDTTLAIEHDLRNVLTGRIEDVGALRLVASELGISVAYLHDVLHGRRPVSEGLAKRMGWERVVVFVKRS